MRWMTMVLPIVLFGSSLYADVQKGYLIITTQSLRSSVQDFARWKTQQGFKVTVATVEDIGSDISSIRQYIYNAVHNWDPHPEYVLLVGGIGLIPSYIRFFDIGVPSVFPFDFLYVADDTLAMRTFAHIGRIPVNSPEEASYVLGKIIFYEKEPLSSTSRWLGRGIVTFNDTMVIPMKVLTREWMFQGGLFDVDSAFVFGYNPGLDTLLSKGYGFHNHRGYPVWFARSPELTNDSMPFVSVFLTCGSAAFEMDNSDGVYLLRDHSGNLTGAATVVGCAASIMDSTNTMLHLRNVLDSLINRSIWIDSIVDIGVGVDMARARLPEHYPNPSSDTLKVAAWELTILGDPSLNVWRGVPPTILADIPDTVQINTPFTISGRASGVSGSNIIATITRGDSLLLADTLGEDNELEAELSDTGSFTVTLTSPYALPVEKEIVVRQHYNPSCSRIYVSNYLLSDKDLDGKFMPLDTIKVFFTYTNTGSDTARNLRVNFSLSGPLEPIYTDYSCGNIPPGRGNTVVIYVARVSGNAQDGEEFSITANFTCDNCSPVSVAASRWVSRWRIEDLQLSYREVQQGDTNSFIDPGDTLKFYLSFLQNGSVPFGPNGSAVLRCSDDNVILMDSTIEDITVEPDQRFDDTTDVFVVAVLPEFPDGDSLHFTVVMRNRNVEENYPLSFPVGGREYLGIAITEADLGDMQVVDSILRYGGFHGFTTVGLSDRYLNHLTDFRTVYIFAASDHVLNYSDLLPVLINYMDSGGNLWFEGGLSFWRLGNALRDRLGARSIGHTTTANSVQGASGSFAEGLLFAPSMNVLPVLEMTDSVHTHPVLVTPDDSIIAVIYEDSVSRAVGFSFSPANFFTSGDIAEFYRLGMGYLLTGVDERYGSTVTAGPVVRFPSFSKGAVRFQIAPSQSNVRISVFDIAGRQIYIKNLPPSGKSRSLSVEFPSSGVYFVVARAGKNIGTGKIIVLK